MSSFQIVFILVYFLTLGIIVFMGFFIQLKKEKGYVTTSIDGAVKTVELNDLTVIIPFRNEEKRIQKILSSIRASHELPKEFIFVDDHSTDSGPELIALKMLGFPFRIISLPVGIEGKKKAIREAIRQTESKYILSLDADIEFLPTYFTNLQNLQEADLYILPAILKAEKALHYLYEVDLILINAVNCGISGLKRPIMASGANMLYKRKSFNEFDRFDQHSHMPSGDDIYLLKDFRNAGADIRLISDTAYAIHTETPQSFKEFIHQRLRWIAKTGDVNDSLSTTFAFVQILFTALYVGIVSFLIVGCKWRVLGAFYLVKTVLDMLLFLPFFNRIKRMRSWLLISIYEILFPLYSLVILVMMYTFKPTWKGRKLNTNF